MLIGGDNSEMFMEDEEEEREGEQKNLKGVEASFDFSGFSIIEEMNGGKPCPKFIVSIQEEMGLCKP